MPRDASPRRIPAYKLHKSSGHAFVTIAGRNHFLGRHGTPGSHEKYDRLIAEWLASRRGAGPGATAGGSAGSGEGMGLATMASGAGTAVTVAELIVAYKAHAEAVYSAGALGLARAALRPLRALYGGLPVAEFTPQRFKVLQRTMAEAIGKDGQTRRLCRGTVNDYSARIRQCFRWGVGEGLVPPAVWQGLTAVPGVRRGRTLARESEPVGPVSDDVVERTLPHLPPTVADMVRVQRLTGARPGEVCAMTAGRIDRTGPVWLYRPRHHKTEHHGLERVIPLGPRAQAVLAPYLLSADPAAPVFSPAAAERDRRRRAERAASPPPSRAERGRVVRMRLRARPPGRAYTAASYRRAVARACVRAGVEAWSPNRLRHSRATELRRTHGLEAASAVLGHARLQTTQVYAARDHAVACAAALATG